MATTSSRVLSLFIAVLVGAAAACAPVHPPFDAAGTNALLVGPRPQDLTIQRLYLWQDATHDDVAVWVSLDPKEKLHIDFKDEIFQEMKRQDNGPFQVQCVGSRCDSGKLKKGVEHNKEYKYTQTLEDPSGEKHSFDGMIIIKP